MKKKLVELLKFLISPLLNEYGVVGAMGTRGLNTLAEGIGNTANLELVATVGTYEEATKAVTFGSATGGVINITTAAGGGGDVSITLDGAGGTGPTIDHVYLRVVGQTLANSIANVGISTDNVFTNGGELIVKTFGITVV